MPHDVSIRSTKNGKEIATLGPFKTEQEAVAAAKNYVETNKKLDHRFYGGGLRTSEHMSYFFGFLELDKEKDESVSIAIRCV